MRKGNPDYAGIVWPSQVHLTGDAKEIHEWTVQYDKEYKKRLSMSRESRAEFNSQEA